MTAPVHFSSSPRPGALLVGTVLLLLVAAGGISYVGTREPTTPESAAPPPASDSPIVQIDLPHEPFPVPPGENREAFASSCVQCHSPRLVFTQPRFPAKKWTEVVAKMANAYKAPLAPDEQKKIVAYLSSVHGE
jgi:hypothetical protein